MRAICSQRKVPSCTPLCARASYTCIHIFLKSKHSAGALFSRQSQCNARARAHGTKKAQRRRRKSEEELVRAKNHIPLHRRAATTTPTLLPPPPPRRPPPVEHNKRFLKCTTVWIDAEGTAALPSCFPSFSLVFPDCVRARKRREKNASKRERRKLREREKE